MMQGQGRPSNSYPENHNFHGLNATNLRLDRHNVDSDDASGRNRQNVMSWMGQPNSSLNTQNQISFVQLLSEDNDAPSGTDQGFEGRQSENGQVRNGPSIVQRTISSAIPNNIDLNATFEGNSNNASQETGAGSSINPFKPGGTEADQSPPPPGIDSPNALLISSGISGYVLEEDDGRRSISSDGRRLSCKRRAPEGSAGKLSLDGSSSSTQQARNSDQEVVIAQENPSSSLNTLGAANNQPNFNHFGRLGAGVRVVMGAPPAGNQTSGLAGTLGAGSGTATVSHQSSTAAANGHEGASVMHQTSNVAGNGHGTGLRAASGTNQASILAGQAENFQRNIRLRRNASQQGFAPSSFSTWNNWNSHVQFPTETAMFDDPWDYLMVPRSAAPPVHATPEVHPPVQVQDPFQTSQLSQGVPISRANGSSSSSAPALNEGYIQNQEEILRNNLRNIMLPSEIERGNLSQMGTNLNFASGSASFPGTVASTSRNGTNSNVQIPSVPSWITNPLLADLYTDRFADFENPLESLLRQDSYFPIHAGTAAGREMENSVRGVNIRPPQRPLRSRLMPRAERQAVAYPDVPPAFRSLSPAQRRSTLVSGVHNAWALVRRGGALRFEDVMLIHHSVLLGESEDEEDDAHEDMRLDVDNMSYEELLALEEQMGSVSTGLSEDAIWAHLRLRKHQSIKVGSPDDDEPCCICREEYADGEDLGKLDCGHDFHANCIKLWLMQKNLCPICKLTALAGRKKDH